MAAFVPFLTIEDGDDLIVSFGLGERGATSLTLLRAPEFESLLSEDERGVAIDDGASVSSERELLISVQWSEQLVRIESTVRQYALDIHTVTPEEVREARTVLRKMNFDNRFELSDV